MKTGATSIGFVAILLWSALAALTSATGAIPPFELAAMTFALSALVGFAVSLVRGGLPAADLPWQMWLLGIGGIFGYHALYFSALRLVPPAQASLLNYLWPLLLVVFSGLLPGERLRTGHVLGAGLGLAGVILLVAGPALSGSGFSLDGAHLAGYAFALGAALVWSTYSVLSRRFRHVSTGTVTYFCAATAILAAICHKALEGQATPPDAGQWAAIVALGLGPLGLAFYVWDYGVKHGDIRLLGVTSYAAPVLSTLILVGTGLATPTLALGLACLLIAGGAALAGWAGRPAKG